AEHSAKEQADGSFILSYDPDIVAPFKTAEPVEDLDLWALWDATRCPTLLVRGAESDLLLAATADEMTGRGPKTELLTIDGVGHAPALMDPMQIAMIESWLFGDDRE
ncbi:MAG: alpha/beta fold hydrolase, partial [Geminicoccaceae bacterium]